jgi:selenide, water dikinase
VAGPDTFRLTQYARGGGCACKIPPGELEETVSKLMPGGAGTDLLVGVEHGDDGAVVRVSPAMAVVVTADFFTPVVDDAYTFGRIAATNALSDIYAMGGEPLVALNLLGWPRDKLPTELAAEVLRGGLDVGRAARCHVAGGHSIDDPEPKYGMAVTGAADPAALLRIDAGQPGLPLSLTKPIGTGVLNAWHKATGGLSPAAIDVMTTLNAGAARRALAAGIRCVTDVTGFGLLGHAYETADRSGVRIVLEAGALPALDGALEVALAGERTGGDRRNRDFAEAHVETEGVPDELVALAWDPQTAGGFLVSLPADQGPSLAAELAARDLFVRRIGRVEAGAGVVLAA